MIKKIVLTVVSVYMLLLNPLVNTHAATPSLYQQIQGLQTAQGVELTGALDKNKATLVKLWASWCPLCLSGCKVMNLRMSI